VLELPQAEEAFARAHELMVTPDERAVLVKERPSMTAGELQPAVALNLDCLPKLGPLPDEETMPLDARLRLA
ncbi:hypothetical protein ACFQ69_36425, partial [Streptomyces sp. NPDC056470]|uniref:hypothetical protein n=1 Tax=Streptomyces sp. NPDC056470 TaxID=3345831 RepID=UPI0036897361